ncbi:hypothetical protein E2C01_013683 [Portunus trituberculatus]|uniref:Uncharacterized protein n=1 Tax=Portunus trituberculatus TaxID=210409 RepID=A0A5B7DH99_PORTR|nr:hypothetical protein [Portunus trituberculatus]
MSLAVSEAGRRLQRNTGSGGGAVAPFLPPFLPPRRDSLSPAAHHTSAAISALPCSPTTLSECVAAPWYHRTRRMAGGNVDAS